MNSNSASTGSSGTLLAAAGALPIVAVALFIVLVLVMRNNRNSEDTHDKEKQAQAAATGAAGTAAAADTSSSSPANSSGSATLLTSTSSIVGKMMVWAPPPSFVPPEAEGEGIVASRSLPSRPPPSIASTAPSFRSILVRPRVYRVPGSGQNSWEPRGEHLESFNAGIFNDNFTLIKYCNYILHITYYIYIFNYTFLLQCNLLFNQSSLMNKL